MRSFGAAVLLTLLAAPATAQTADSTAVLDAVHSFHRALASGDSLAALGWLSTDAIIFEGGHAETRDQYRSGHLRGDIGFATATTRVLEHEAVSLMGDGALYLGEAHTTGRVRDRDIDSRGTETAVLVRTPEGWRIRHFHWSSRR